MYKCKKKDCYYRRSAGSGGTDYSYCCCCYMLFTGEKRGCPADNCDKYISMAEAKRLGLGKQDS